jgi:beta-N-acetylhexosaminidase
MTSPGELFIYGFEGKEAPPALLERIAVGRAAGVILFTRNLGTLPEIAALNRRLQHATPRSAPPIIVSVDQEGGRVQRVKAPHTVWPPMARLGERGDAGLSEAVGRALGAELAALGFNVDYAPVLDVHTNPENPIIGDRAFGTTPELAVRHALAFWRGLDAAGVRGCGKHFPGHGDTATDSHLDLPCVGADRARLYATELRPFVEAVAAGVPMIMTAHVVYPAIDERPATLSKKWLTDILRGELGFAGVIVSDDLDMKAVAARWPVEETVVESLLAGADAFLVCRDPEVQARAEAALQRAQAADPRVRERIEESAARLSRFRATLVRQPAPDALGRLPLATHAELARRMTG